MSLICIAFLLLISRICTHFHRPRWAQAGYLLTAALVLLILTGFLPQVLLNTLQVKPYLSQPQWKTQNTIILLGGGSVKWADSSHFSSDLPAFSRVLEAARLYQDCIKKSVLCSVLVTGGDPKNYGLSEAEVMSQELQQLSVERKDILLETKSRNTFENAQFSKVLIPFNSQYTVLVTSATHMKRSLLLFSYFGVQAEAAPSDQLVARFSLNALTYNFYLLDLVLHEYGGIIKFYLQTL
jgi:uncharacterized SAM-binding protein YcdF (DUF218 family)